MKKMKKYYLCYLPYVSLWLGYVLLKNGSFVDRLEISTSRHTIFETGPEGSC